MYLIGFKENKCPLSGLEIICTLSGLDIISVPYRV